MQTNNLTTLTIPPTRVLGWDLLRGMCSFAVATYHLLYWQGLASIHTLGSYGVYLFFVLSGASLAYNYIDQFETRTFSFLNFLRVRYLRLAPLHLALMLIALPWKVFKDGFNQELVLNYFLNATFLFGFFNPSTNAVLVGGWSLGIEAIFYLTFPYLMLSFRSTRLAACIFFLLICIQIGWIVVTVGQIFDASQNIQAYFQAPAFAAYFMGGCVLGVAKRKGLLEVFTIKSIGLTAMLAGFVLMITVNPTNATDEILGWRGYVLAVACFAMVYAASKTSVQGILKRWAKYFGDATYGLYLLHPVLFFGLVKIIFPRLGVSNPVEWTDFARMIFGSSVIGLAFWLALLSERYFEKPVRFFLSKKA